MTRRAWWRTAVFYEIYVRSFQDSDGDGIGDLPGIISRLDYLRGSPDSLGIDAIWLTPFYPSPGADFGYDISDHMAVDPTFGTTDDVRQLIGEAHSRGIRVIIDWVPNHTSIEHPWFMASRSSRENAKRNWYVWRPGRTDSQPPNNWMADFAGVGRAWTFDTATDEWYLHSFTPSQPDLDWSELAVRQGMLSVLRYWLDLGVDGFRMDVINKIGKDPLLRDNPSELIGPGQPPSGRRHDEDWTTTFERIREVRQTVKSAGARVAIGEVYVLDQRRLVDYLRRGRLDLAHNFVFLNQPWSSTAFRACVDEFWSLLPKGAWPSWCLNNHDHSRVATRYGDSADGGNRARIAAMMLLTLPGTPFIYQGEELGLGDLSVAEDEALDVDGRDRSRAPQPWDRPSAAGRGAGFTVGRPWLPVSADAETRNVATEASDEDSMFNLYRRLLSSRRQEPGLRDGSYTPIDAGTDVFAYLRRSAEQTLLVVLNFAGERRRFACRDADLGDTGRIVTGTRIGRAGQIVRLDRLNLGGHEGLLVNVRACV